VLALGLMAFVLTLILSLSFFVRVSAENAATGQNSLRAEQNAFLSLQMAIGQLQKHAGVDQAITATSDLLASVEKRGYTGVWGSEPIDPNSSVDKSGAFKTWLISSPTADQLDLESALEGNSASSVPSVSLLSSGTLGSGADPSRDFVATPTYEVSDINGRSGRLAWATFDEGVKVRANLEFDEQAFEDAPQTSEYLLGAARRANIGRIDGLEVIDWNSARIESVLSLDSFGILSGTPEKNPVKDRFHDVTVSSFGVLASTSTGGLRRDLSIAFETEPSWVRAQPEQVFRRPYYNLKDSLNPWWSYLADYATAYKNMELSSFGDFSIQASSPDRARSFNFRRGLEMRQNKVLAPVVAKVQMALSVVARDPHGGWDAKIRTGRADTFDPKPSTAREPIDLQRLADIRGVDVSSLSSEELRYFMVHLMFTPIVTLYNPYDVALEFEEMRCKFQDVPIGFQPYVNGRPQTSDFVTFNRLSDFKDGRAFDLAKVFEVTLKSGFDSGETIVLRPGECRTFGAMLPPDYTWDEEMDEGGYGALWFDPRYSISSKVNCIPGWIEGIGFDIDWLTPLEPGESDYYSEDFDQTGILSLVYVEGELEDEFDIKFKPLVPSSARNTFFTEISIKSGGVFYDAGRIELNYSSAATLDSMFASQELPIYGKTEFPYSLEYPLIASDIFERGDTSVSDYINAKTFAVFSFQGKTTLDSTAPNKAWAFSNPAAESALMVLPEENPAIQPYEFVMAPVQSIGAGTAGSVEIDPQNRAYYFTGHTRMTGVTSAPHYELPRVPLQSVVQLRHAGIISNGLQPIFDYTVGESFAHPLLPPEEIISPGLNHSSYDNHEYADYAWLANDALLDDYFFSTIAPHEGAAFNGAIRSLDEIIGGFVFDNESLINDRYIPYALDDPDEVVDLLKGDDGYRVAAAAMLAKGAFNVNSTSIDAWVSLLSGISGVDVSTLNPTTGAITVVEGANNVVSRIRRPLGNPLESLSGGTPEFEREERWLSFRTLDDATIVELAREIVNQVRERGPFFSLAEFFNRSPGSDREKALYGAVQAAIETVGINQDYAADGQVEIGEVGSLGYAFPEAAAGDAAQGAPGYVTQGDLLSPLAPYLSVRSDTFKIRGYGAANGLDGEAVAEKWYEAVIQRTPEFVVSAPEENADPTDGNAAWESVEINGVPSPTLNEINRMMGRQFVLVSFRWLQKDEI